MAIKANGTLWGWGWNELGQLGDGTNENRNTPVQIGITTDWQMVEAGVYHTTAIKSDGTLWAWGQNNYGQLGNGTITQELAPVQIGVATNWQQVSGGGGHTIATRSDGALWAWGRNASGQLGNGTTSSSDTPIEINCPFTPTSVEAFSYRGDNILIFPNPAQDYIAVKMAGFALSGLSYEIRNILGEVMFSGQSLSNNQRIELNNLVTGVYILTVKNRKGHISKQFMKI